MQIDTNLNPLSKVKGDTGVKAPAAASGDRDGAAGQAGAVQQDRQGFDPQLLSEFKKEIDLAPNTELDISLNKEANMIVVKVVNAETNEVIRQIPADEVLSIAIRIRKNLGVLVDKQV